MGIVIADGRKRANPYLNRIKLVLGDIAAQDVDAIVTILPQSMERAGRINSAIDASAGEMLGAFLEENIYKPKQGDVYAVPGFNMPAKHILLAFRPAWKSDFEREDRQLVGYVRKIMVLSHCMLLTSLAFPPLASSSKTGYGKKRAARLLIQGILDRMDDRTKEVRIVCDDETTYEAYRKSLVSFGWAGS